MFGGKRLYDCYRTSSTPFDEPFTQVAYAMIAFLIKRLMHAILVMFVISVLAFAIQDNLGEPVQQMVGQSVPESEREEIRERLGLNDPFLVQYARFANNAVQGDFG